MATIVWLMVNFYFSGGGDKFVWRSWLHYQLLVCYIILSVVCITLKELFTMTTMVLSEDTILEFQIQVE